MRRFGLELEFMGHGLRLQTVADLIQNTIQENVETEDEVDWDCFDPSITWMIKYDASCELELTTPAVRWRDYPKVARVCRALYRAGARTNRRCGLHVHHEANDFSAAQLQKLWYVWSIYEPTLFKLLAPSRASNNFCERLSTWENHDRTHDWVPEFSSDNVLTMPENDFRNVVDDYGRYQSLNMTEWWRTGRLEIRAHHGTLNPRDIKLWTLLTQRLIIKTKTMSRNRIEQIKGDVAGGNAVQSLADTITRPTDTSNRLNWSVILPELVARRNPTVLTA